MSSGVQTAFILVGGFGSRLKSVVPVTPKPLAPIKTHCFLDYLLHSLEEYSLKRVVLLTGYRAQDFAEYAKQNRFSFEVLVSEEKTPLGSAGALKLAQAKLGEEKNVLVLNGDTYYDGSLEDFFLEDPDSANVIGVHKKDPADRFGLVELGADEKVLRFCEKQPNSAGYVYSGIARLNAKVLDMIPPGQVSLEQEIFPKLIGNLKAIKLGGDFYDIGLPESYQDFIDRFGDYNPSSR